MAVRAVHRVASLVAHLDSTSEVASPAKKVN